MLATQSPETAKWRGNSLQASPLLRVVNHPGLRAWEDLTAALGTEDLILLDVRPLAEYEAGPSREILVLGQAFEGNVDEALHRPPREVHLTRMRKLQGVLPCVRTDARHELATHDPHGHVAVAEEGEPAEHLPLRQGRRHVPWRPGPVRPSTRRRPCGESISAHLLPQRHTSSRKSKTRSSRRLCAAGSQCQSAPSSLEKWGCTSRSGGSRRTAWTGLGDACRLRGHFTAWSDHFIPTLSPPSTAIA